MKRCLKILTEVELSYLISEAPIIAVTGTNGKTTVTSLIGDMFKKSRLTGRLSGNIGYVASKVAQEVQPTDYLLQSCRHSSYLESKSINHTLL